MIYPKAENQQLTAQTVADTVTVMVKRKCTFYQFYGLPFESAGVEMKAQMNSTTHYTVSNYLIKCF